MLSLTVVAVPRLRPLLPLLLHLFRLRIVHVRPSLTQHALTQIQQTVKVVRRVRELVILDS